MPEARSRKHEGVYFVVVDGVPRHCQWQELKDYLRDFAKVRPGHTNVIKLNEDGTRVGYCPLPNKTEAYRAFDYLVAEGWQGLDIRVSVIWKTDLHSPDIQRKRGPEPSRRRRSQTNISPSMRLQSGAHYMRPSTSSLEYNADFMARTVSNMSVPTSNGFCEPRSYSITLPSPTYSRVNIGQNGQSYHYYSNPGAQTYDHNGLNYTAIPASIFQTQNNNFALYKDRQSIHISRLRHDIKSPQLKQMLAQYGQVSEVTIKRGKEKRCSATAKYQRPTDALLAIQELNGRVFEGLELVVRHDRSEDASSGSSTASTVSKRTGDSNSKKSSNTSHLDSTSNNHHNFESQYDDPLLTGKPTYTHIGPLVVNGARGTNHYRRRGDCAYDDDSESAADSSNEHGSSGGNGHNELRSHSWNHYREQIPTQ